MMSEVTKNQQAFVGYEYKELEVPHELASVYIDGYQNFGWALEDSASSREQRKTNLTFKRDRKIVNKMELTRLQRQFDAFLFEIKELELAKTRTAMGVALLVGIGGTVFMALSTFAYLGAQYVGSVLFAIPGFLGWILPYMLYQRLVRKKTQELEPLIDQQYDKVYELCEKAHALLVRA